MENMTCPIHNELFTHFCIVDATCVCTSCRLIGEHQGHQMETLAETSEKKKQKIKDVLQALTTKKEGIMLQEERLQASQKKAVTAAKEVTFNLKELGKNLTDLQRQVQEMYKCEGKAGASDLILQKDELSKKIGLIEELCKMTDPLDVLQASNLVEKEGQGEEEGKEDQLNVASKSEKQADDSGCNYHFMEDSLKHVSEVMSGFNIDFFTQKGSRSSMCLDKTTAKSIYCVSEDLKTLSESCVELDDSEPSDEHDLPVLSVNSFSSGRHYFDVKIGGSDEWAVGFCYPSIARAGEESMIGQSNKSWGMRVYISTCSAEHGGKSDYIENFGYNNVRLYLDYEAGRISFYELGETTTLLHTFAASFTEPLHAIFSIWNGCVISLGDLVSFDRSPVD